MSDKRNLLDSILALHERGYGAIRIANTLVLPLPKVLRIANEAGVSLRRPGRPPAPRSGAGPTMPDTPTPSPPPPGPSLAAQVATLADFGFGLTRIAQRLNLPERDVMEIAQAAGVEVRRGGRPPVAHPRDHRVTLNLTAAEWSAIVASVAEVGTVSVPEWCRGVVVAAAGGAR